MEAKGVGAAGAVAPDYYWDGLESAEVLGVEKGVVLEGVVDVVGLPSVSRSRNR